MIYRISHLNRLCAILAAMLLFCGCAGNHTERVNLNSVAWMQTSDEYHALTLGAYNRARRSLDDALENPGWTALPSQVPANSNDASVLAKQPVAVILDIDEAVLSTLPYQAWLVKSNRSFTEASWNAWVSEANAVAIPGALEFVEYAKRKGVAVFYLSNRAFRGPLDSNRNGKIDFGEDLVGLKSFTITNLVKQGFLPQRNISNDDSVLLRGETDSDGLIRKGWAPSDKFVRRESLSSDYRVVLIVGDNINDFLSGRERLENGDVADTFDEYWGRSWVMLPNPIYGSWESRLYGSDRTLSNQEKVDIKLERLDSWQ